MPYVVDGHNLIPKIPGLNLEDIDDELQLIKLLQEFCRVNQKKVEVYFDNAPAGSTGTRTFGSVVARFIRQGRTADQAIQEKLRRLGGEARNWTVVSSDREVQFSARKAGAKILQAEDFAEHLLESIPDEGQLQQWEKRLSSQEVDEWMELFGLEEEDQDY